jgi:hypothetical protein
MRYYQHLAEKALSGMLQVDISRETPHVDGAIHNQFIKLHLTSLSRAELGWRTRRHLQYLQEFRAHSSSSKIAALMRV